MCSSNNNNNNHNNINRAAAVISQQKHLHWFAGVCCGCVLCSSFSGSRRLWLKPPPSLSVTPPPLIHLTEVVQPGQRGESSRRVMLRGGCRDGEGWVAHSTPPNYKFNAIHLKCPVDTPQVWLDRGPFVELARRGRGGEGGPFGSARLRSAPCLRPDWETNWMSNAVTCGAAGA